MNRISNYCFSFLSGTRNQYQLQLSVKAKAKESLIKIESAYIVVKTKTAPIDNQANESVIRALAEFLNIDTDSITIIRGGSSKHKIVQIKNEPKSFDELEKFL